MATAVALSPISTPSSVARCPPAIPPNRRPAKSVICRASMVTSQLPPLSKRRKYHLSSLLSSTSSISDSLLTLFSYLELYASTEQGVGSFFGNRSIVVHTNNKTRLNCANFSLVAGTQPSSGGSGSGPTPTSPPPAQFTGSAAVKTVSLGAVVIGLAAAVIL
jgi:hypothetical protein